jgi:hypothetical protein
MSLTTADRTPAAARPGCESLAAAGRPHLPLPRQATVVAIIPRRAGLTGCPGVVRRPFPGPGGMPSTPRILPHCRPDRNAARASDEVLAPRRSFLVNPKQKGIIR